MATKITSWEGLQQEVPRLLVTLNKDPALARAAAANPLLALQELGYELEPPFADYVEDRLRFSGETAQRLHELRQEIFHNAGRSFDIRSEEQLDELLFERLRLQAFDERGCPLRLFDVSRPNKRNKSDKLEALLGLHPIMAPLLQFRQLDATTAHFADRATYEAIRRDQQPLSLRLNLHPRLKNNA